jgi:uncharacterized protein (TIGR03437 family)
LAPLGLTVLFTAVAMAGTNPATITMVVPSPIPYLQPFTMQVIVTGAFGPGTGQVELVIDNTTYFPNVILDTTGKATIAVPGPQIPQTELGNVLAPGIHSVGVIYSGDSHYLAQLFTANQVPQAISPLLTLTASSNSILVGQSVHYTATLNVGPGQPPGGTVTFFDNGTQLGTPVAVSGGQAVTPPVTPSIGTHSITATYSGDSIYGTANAGPVFVVVTVPPSSATTLTLTSSINPSGLGQSVVFTATLKSDPGAGTPMGAVQFLDGTTLLSAVQVANGQAVLNTTSLSAGSHAIVAKYAGDGFFQPALASIGQVVNPLASTINLTASPSTPIFGQTITATAQVGPTTPPLGYSVPTGTVTFEDNFRPVGTVPLSKGAASWDFKGAGVGPITITAIYNGDGTWGSSHATTTLTVGPAAPLQMTNAAANYSASFAPDETVSAFNVSGLNGDTSGAVPLGTALGGVTVTVTDSAGTARQAQLYGVFASTGQVNFVMPAGTALGTGAVAIALPSVNAGECPGGGCGVPPAATLTASMNVTATAPGIFSAGLNGQGVFAGQVVHVHQDNTQTMTDSATWNPASKTYDANPISLAPATDQVFLQMYGTGLRHASSVTATVNGVSVPTVFAAQSQYPGLDQVNLQLPASLAGAGTVNIVIMVAGQPANTVTALIQ